MEFNFNIKNDRLTSCGHNFGFTGNVNTYLCRFEVECDIDGIIWFCVFKQGEKIYRQLIENGLCIIPQEVLKNQEPLYVGCYGTNADDEIKRISTNLIFFDIKQGAYSEATAPETPSPDVWEMLVSKTVPIIGENGNWYIYDVSTESYIDTGTLAKGEMGPQGVQGEKGDKGDAGERGAQGEKGEAGYTPQKGTDYFTEADKAEIVEVVKKDIDLDGKQDELSDVQIESIDKIPMIEETANLAKEIGEAANTNAFGALDLASINSGRIDDVENQKQDKVAIITNTTDLTGTWTFEFENMHNSEIRLLSADMVYVGFKFGNGVYAEDYTSGISFSSGETPTTISYTDSGILNWVGTDCTTSDGLSIFQPSANTHYDIVFYFNGTQMIGLVNGYVPASGKEAV